MKKSGKFGSSKNVSVSQHPRGQRFVQSTGQDKQDMSHDAKAYTGQDMKGGSTNLSHSIKGASST